MFLQDCFDLLDGRRVLLLEDLVSDDPRKHVAGNVRAEARSGNAVLPASALGLGLMVQSWELRGGHSCENVFTALDKERQDGLYVLGGALVTC